MPHQIVSPADTEVDQVSLQKPDRDFAEVPGNIVDKLQGASPFRSGFNQQNIFDVQYYEAARQYYEDAVDTQQQGRTILKLFLRWKPVVERFARMVLRDDVDNPLDATLAWDPEGAGEAMVRPLRTDSFEDSGGTVQAQYAQTPTATGQFNIIPDDTQADGTTITATGNEAAWIIFGWIERLASNEMPYDYLQADINDNKGIRREEFLLWQMEGPDTLKVSERIRGPLIVEPGFDLDVDVNVKTTNITTGLWPVGIEVIRADAPEFGGVLG